MDSNEYSNGTHAPPLEANVVDNVDYTRGLSKAQLQKMSHCLEVFAKELKGSDEEKDEPQCMVIAGSMTGIGPGATDDLVADQCRIQFGEDAAWGSKAGTLHIILDSRGGSLDSAYKSLLYLRRFAETIRVYVPRHTKSAAMLISIGADEILMSPMAELGPLDTQLRDPRNPSQDFSVLDCYQSVDYVREFGLSTLPMALRVLLADVPPGIQSRTPSGELISKAIDFALGGVAPMLTNVKALDFGSWGRTLKIGETYARSVLTRLKDERAEERVAERIARQLVYGYTHHPYPIDIEEAARIGLHVAVMPHALHKPAFDLVKACNGSRFVGFSRTIDELMKQAEDGSVFGGRAMYSQTLSGARVSVVADTAVCPAGTEAGPTND